MVSAVAGPSPRLHRVQVALSLVAGVTAVILGAAVWWIGSLGAELTFGAGPPPEAGQGAEAAAVGFLILVGALLLVAGTASWQDRSWGPWLASGGAGVGSVLGLLLVVDGLLAAGLISLVVFGLTAGVSGVAPVG